MSNTRTSERRPYTFDRVMRIVFSVIGLVVTVLFIDYIKMVLLPFLIGWLIAYILEPFVQYNRWILRTKGRFWAVMMTLFEACLMVVFLGVIFLPSVFSEFHQVGMVMEQYAMSGSHIPFLPSEFDDYLRKLIDFQWIADFLKTQGVEKIIDMLPAFLSQGLDLVMFVVNGFFTLLYVIFIMLDYDKLIRGFRRMVPPKYRARTFSIGKSVKDSMNHYFRGQALVSLCVGVLYAIGFAIVGLPLSVVMGLSIGILSMVPYLQFISLIPVTLLCLICSVNTSVDFWALWWSCILVYVVVQCLYDLVLTPKIMGKMMGLNPAVILFSLSLWGTLLGFVGLIIALPLTTLLMSYYDQYITMREDGESPSERKKDAEALEDIVDDSL